MELDQAALLRPLRAAGRVGRSEVHAGARRRSWCSPRSRRSAPTTRRRSAAPSTAAGSISFRTTARRSGAYSNGGAYDVHPYMLINYNGQYTDVSTLAHELGPHDAELLLEQDAAVPAGRLSDLRRRGGVDVQRVAADRLHARDRSRTTTRGCRCSATTSRTSRAPCSGRRSSPSSSCGCTRWRRRASRSPATRSRSSTSRSRRKYYGHDQGVCIVDDYIAHEWSYIPHFYRDFYVFQYATSFTASAALAEKVKAGDRRRRRSAISTSCRAGGSKYPIDLLKDAGVDMTTDEPLDLTIKKMNRVMDEMEKILAKKTR